MQIKMDTDAVRAMSSRLRSTADSMDAKLASVRQTMSAAGWQSQAREEFIMQLELLQRSTVQSASVMRLMAQAANRKADQWEAIANVFNGPFYYLERIWDSVTGFFGRVGNNIWKEITSIRLPNLPKFVFPSISSAVVVGGIQGIIPKWEWTPPAWWPFNRNDKTDKTAGGGGGGGSWGSEDSKESESSTKNEESQTPSGSNDTPPQKSNDKPYPHPPTSPKLEEANGNPSGYTCATYAKDRRPDLGSTQSNNEKFADGAAANYISKFEDKAFQIETSGEPLEEMIGPGYALVWEPNHPSANDKYGHVAIIEEVYPDHVIISEASSWPSGTYQIKTRKITMDQLNNDLVWLIP